MTTQKSRNKQSTRDALSTFVPQTMKWILQQETNLTVPYSKQFPSVALFADISGFTNLTEKLSALPGTLGVETLADEINNYLTQIIKQIVGSGGDIFKFAGDALLCVWPPNQQEMNDMIMAWKNLSKTVLRVIRCALDIQKSLGEMSKCGVPELILRVKLGIGVGNVDVLVVGGVMGRFENLPAGQAFFEAFNCENDCKPQQVIISNKCYQMCKAQIGDCEAVGPLGNYLVKSIKYRIGKRRNMNADSLNLSTMSDQNDSLFKKFSRYIPSAVVPHLRMPEQAWVGELRQVTIMFLSLPFNSTDIKNIGSNKGENILKEIHDSIRQLQTIIYRYQGSLNKFLVDDKGSTVMAVFGLPPVAHRNDPERAVMAALDLRKKFKARYTKKLLSLLGGATLDVNKTKEQYDRDKDKNKKKKDKMKHKAKEKTVNGKKKNIIAIGITSGIVYLGLVGGAGSRREYSVLGDKVNLAARLMGLSKKEPHIYGEIAVDESIKSKVMTGEIRHELDWKFIKTTKVKGKKQNINVYSPVPKIFIHHVAIPPIAWLTDASDKSYITECSRVIERLHKYETGKVVFVEGEAGLGKAALISRVMHQTKNRIWWLWGKGSWLHETKEALKFPVWKQILLSFEIKYPFWLSKNRKSFEHYIEKRRPDLHQWLFLLSYFNLLSFVSPTEYDPNIHIEKDRKDLIMKRLRNSAWQRNDKLVQELKDKIQLRMSVDAKRFEQQLTEIKDDETRKLTKRKKEEEWRLSAELKVNKKIGNFIYDIVFCLLEWAGGKLAGTKPIAIVIDGLQWLRTWDWSLTRRLCLMLENNILKHVTLFISSTPMDIRRYTPHYIRKYYTAQYQEMRDGESSIVILPAAWGIQKTKKYIKSYFKHEHNINVRDVSPKLVETVHSQSGGRPGFCKEFLDILFQLPSLLTFGDMRYKGEKKLSFSLEFEQHLSSRTQYSSIPIPASVQAITARHLDVLNPESMLCLKTAATICISKGTRCLSFLKSTLRGSHPIKQFVEPISVLDNTLEKLCKMKFIAKLPSKQDISNAIDVNENGNGNGNAAQSELQPRKRTLPCQLYKQSSMLNHTQHGHLENHYHSELVHHHSSVSYQKHDENVIKDRYGSAANNVVARNKIHINNNNNSLADMSRGTIHHLRNFSGVSDRSDQTFSDRNGSDQEMQKNMKMTDDENKHKRDVEDMPLTSQLVVEPLHAVAWKKGILWKSKGGLLSTGSDRVFVFKNKTLYWFRDSIADKYPLGSIKFGESILRLQLNEKKKETLIKVSRKKYILRAKSLPAMQEWFKLFQNAMNSTDNSMNNSMQNMENMVINEEKSVDPGPDADNEYLSNTHGECYEFTHGFLRDAIYEQMLSTQRIRIHKTAQEYLRKVLKAISYLPKYLNKDLDTKDYTSLLQRHQSIAQNYQKQQKNIGEMVAEDGKKKHKKKKHKFPGFIGLD